MTVDATRTLRQQLWRSTHLFGGFDADGLGDVDGSDGRDACVQQLEDALVLLEGALRVLLREHVTVSGREATRWAGGRRSVRGGRDAQSGGGAQGGRKTRGTQGGET